jgi:hypothetical protein
MITRIKKKYLLTMNLKGILLFIFTFLWIYSFSQTGKIAGRVISSKGEGLISAVVTISLGEFTKPIQTDYNGDFKFNDLKPGKYRVVAKYVGFDNTVLENIEVIAGQTTPLNIVLFEKQKTLKDITIKGKVKKDNVSALLIMQKNAASVGDAISAEAIKRSPDKSTSDVLKRVSGASIQDNKFAIIRGLNERYNAAYLNGSPLPSSESDRKAFAFDIFPSNMLDNLIITKTATPDQTGEFAGGIILINTKNIPDENFQSFSFGLGYNNLTTFKEKITYKGGSLDFLGLEDGTRRVPKDLPALKNWPVDREGKAQAAKLMPNDWGSINSIFGTNVSLQYTIGKSFKIKTKDAIGLLFSLTYSSSPNKYDQYFYAYDQNDDNKIQTNLKDQNFNERILAGALLNLSWKINENNSVSFKNIYSINSEDRVVRRVGAFNLNQIDPLRTESNLFWFTSNQIITNQLNSEHFIPKTKTKVNLLFSNGNVDRLTPGMRRLLYTAGTGEKFQANIVSNADFASSTGGTYLYTTINENIKSAQIDFSQSFDFNKNFKNNLKVGLNFQTRNRDFFARKLNLAKYQQTGGGGVLFEDSLLYLNDKEIFLPQNIGILANGKGGFMLEQIINPYDAYDASANIFSRYFMVDTKIGARFRAIWGSRLETFYLKLNSTRDDRSPINLNTIKYDFLPSLNLVYSLNEKQNLRGSYSETLNRPEFRELAPFVFYDFTNRYTYTGNDTITRCKIYNYDLRYEYFPGKNQLLSGSLFFKQFIDPIEQRSNPNNAREVTYVNASSAQNYGFEFEFRTLLSSLFNTDSVAFLENTTIFSNYAFITSNVIVNRENKTIDQDRRLQGQSPYVLNAGIQYVNPKSGYSATISLNSVGDRISIVGNVNEPSLWEQGRTVIDLQLSKTFLKKKLEIRLNAKDILVQDLLFYNDLNNNGQYDKDSDLKIISRNFGNEFSFSAAYKF